MTLDYVTTPDLRILSVLAGLAGHNGRLWCFPSQATILDLLARRYARYMSRRTLNRHLGALVVLKYLRRVRRHKTAPDGSLEMHSTVYVMLQRCTRTLRGVAGYLAAAAAHPWASRQNNAVPIPAHSEPPQREIMDGGARKDRAPPPSQWIALRAMVAKAWKPMPRE